MSLYFFRTGPRIQVRIRVVLALGKVVKISVLRPVTPRPTSARELKFEDVKKGFHHPPDWALIQPLSPPRFWEEKSHLSHPNHL